MYKYSFIITTYKRSEHIQRILNEISKLTYDKNLFEVLIFNDGNDIQTQSIVENCKDFDLIYMYSNTRIYGSAARNICIRKAKGEFLIFLDDDVQIVENFLSILDRYDNYDAFTFKILNHRKIHTHGIVRYINNLFFGKILMPLGLFLGDFTEGPSNTTMVDHFPGCFFCCRRTCVVNAKFDEYIGNGNGFFDELTFCIQINKKIKLHFIGSESILHFQAASGGYREHDLKRFYYYYFNHKSYIVKNYGNTLFAFTAFFPNLLESFLISILKRNNIISIFLKAWIDGIKKIHKHK